MGEIYMIENIINGKKYIGQTSKTAIDRFRQHIKIAYGNLENKKQAIHHAIEKYGEENFRLYVLEKDVSPELIDQMEIFYIKKYNSKTPNGYNILDGGQGGNRKKVYKIHPTENIVLEEYESASQAETMNPGLTRSSISKAAKHVLNGYGGFRWSYEYNFYDTQMPLKNKDPRVYQINKDTHEIVAEYKSGTEAALITGINERNIYSSMKSNGNKIAGGYYWCYIREYSNFKPILHTKRIIQINPNTGEHIKIWDSAKDIAIYLNKKIKTASDRIRNACLGKVETAYGYKWKYFEEQ